MNYPDHVWRAMRVAYATHFRAFMVFVHSGRPPVRRDKDIFLSSFLRKRQQHRPVVWTRTEATRLAAADKLAAHITTGRNRRAKAKVEWGGPKDRALILRRIRQVMSLVPAAKDNFPQTAVLIKRSLH